VVVCLGRRRLQHAPVAEGPDVSVRSLGLRSAPDAAEPGVASPADFSDWAAGATMYIRGTGKWVNRPGSDGGSGAAGHPPNRSAGHPPNKSHSHTSDRSAARRANPDAHALKSPRRAEILRLPRRTGASAA